MQNNLEKRDTEDFLKLLETETGIDELVVLADLLTPKFLEE